MIVIDASFALDLALATVDSGALLARIRNDGRALAAPEVIDLEVLQALRRQVRLGHVDKDRAETAIAIFDSLPIERFSHRIVATRIWGLRNNLTAYDAAYFALAEALGAPLWTRDVKFKSVLGHGAEVVVH